MKKNIFLTGGTGLVGQSLLNKLAKNGYNVYIGTRKKNLKKKNNIKYVNYNLKGKLSKKLEKVIKICDIVIHCAAVKNSKKNNNFEILEKNLLGTYKLIDLAVKLKVKHIVYISAVNLFNNTYTKKISEKSKVEPQNIYTFSKYLSELVCQYYFNNSNTNFTILRISAPYGQKSKQKSVVEIFLKNMKENKNIYLFGSGNRSQVFTYVEDIASSCIFAIKNRKYGTFNIAGNKTTSMKSLANSIISLNKNSKSKVIYLKKKDPFEKQRRYVEINKAKKILKFKPTDLKDGLKKMFNNY